MNQTLKLIASTANKKKGRRCMSTTFIFMQDALPQLPFLSCSLSYPTASPEVSPEPETPIYMPRVKCPE